jgi:hypothetical protein
MLLMLRSISFITGLAHTHPYLSTNDARQSIEGAIRDDRLIGRGARDQELDDIRDTRHKIYTGSDRQCDVKPYVLCSVGLYCWNTR